MPQYTALQTEPVMRSGKAQVASIFLFRQFRTHRRKFSDSRSFSRQRTLLARLLPRYDESLSRGRRGPSHHRIRQRPVPDSRKDHPLHAQHRRRRNLPRRNARIPTDPKSLARTRRHPSLKIPAPLGFPTYVFFLGFIFVVADLQNLCENSCGSGGHDFSRAACGCPTTRF